MNDEKNWFKEAQYGMMIHFGLYSLLAGEYKGKQMGDVIAEWIQSYFQIPVKEYEKLTKTFNPIYFDADEWTDLAIKAGMKYIVITSKHHEGFALFHSKVDKFNVVDATPFKRDIIEELSDACHRKGLKFGIYYSQELDWHEQNSDLNKRWKSRWNFPNDSENYERCFRSKIIPQVTELLTNYGDIDLIWFDTPQDISPSQSKELFDLVKKIQPKCLVNSRIGNGLGDYKSAGDNEINVERNEVLLEVPATMNGSWGFKYYDNNWKDPEYILETKNMLKKKGINYLLNVGPDGLGRIPSKSIDILLKVRELELIKK